MAYGKPSKSGSMTSPKGLCSSKGNPLRAPKELKTAIGPNSNADSQKANRLLQKAQKQQDSLRGKSGM